MHSMNHSKNIGTVRKIKEDELDLWIAFPKTLDDKDISERVEKDKKWIKRDKVPIDNFFVYEKENQFFGKICLSGPENDWHYLTTPTIKDCDDIKMIANNLYHFAITESKQYKNKYIETFLRDSNKHFEILQEAIQEVGFIETHQFYVFTKNLSKQIDQEKNKIIKFVSSKVFGLNKIKKLYVQSREQSLLYLGHPCPPEVDTDWITNTNEDFIVALKDEEPIGFSGIYIYNYRGDDVGGLEYICVLPQFRGNGYGKIIHRKSLNALRKKGVTEYRGATNIENYPMIDIFKSNGCIQEKKLGFAYMYKFSDK